ncbi:MAG: hypothetical protein JXA68_09060 [Ignavibacteriales bacterium]|nr:hypothetical protein [Ignavibacteriales bacterium]
MVVPRDISWTPNQGIKYQSFMEDTDVWDNLVLGNCGEKIDQCKGIEFEISEIIGISYGSVNGPGYPNRKTNGFSLRTKGLFNILDALTENEVIDFIANHFDVQYIQSTYFR